MHCRIFPISPEAYLVRVLLVLAVVLAPLTASAASTDSRENNKVVRIAAASSLQFALNEIATAFADQTGAAPPQIVYGSSGNLFRQIMQGASFDLFVSADSKLVSRLVEAGRTDGAGAQFGSGRLVLYRGKSTGLELDQSLVGFRAALQAGRVNKDDKPINFKLAMANPRHAPYGLAAQQALESLQLWDLAKPHLVFGEKVSQAAQFVASGASEMGLISLSLALSEPLRQAGDHVVIDAQHHQPLPLSMALLDGSAKLTGDLYGFVLQSPLATEILQKYGLR